MEHFVFIMGQVVNSQSVLVSVSLSTHPSSPMRAHAAHSAVPVLLALCAGEHRPVCCGMLDTSATTAVCPPSLWELCLSLASLAAPSSCGNFICVLTEDQ